MNNTKPSNDKFLNAYEIGEIDRPAVTVTTSTWNEKSQQWETTTETFEYEEIK